MPGLGLAGGQTPPAAGGTPPPQPTAPKIATSSTTSPIGNSNDWMTFRIRGVTSPTIAKDGVRGFKRETGWDKKKGKGSQGATLTLTAAPPCEGSIVCQLISPADFAAWDAFVAQALSVAQADQQAQGLQIDYPGFASVGLTKVVVEWYTPPYHRGKGLYHVEIKMCEWQQPPAASIVSTVASTSSDVPGGDQTPPIDPTTLAQTQTLALLQRATKT